MPRFGRGNLPVSFAPLGLEDVGVKPIPGAYAARLIYFCPFGT